MPRACVNQLVGAASHALHTLGSALCDPQLPGSRGPQSEAPQGLGQGGAGEGSSLGAENAGVAVGMKRKGSGAWAGPELVLEVAGAEAPVLASILPWSRKASRTGPENRPASPLSSSSRHQRERLVEMQRLPPAAEAVAMNAACSGGTGSTDQGQQDASGLGERGGQGFSTEEDEGDEEEDEEEEETEEEEEEEGREGGEDGEGGDEERAPVGLVLHPAQHPSLMDLLLGGEEVGEMEEEEMGVRAMGGQAGIEEEQGWGDMDTGSPRSCSSDSESDPGADLRAAVREVVGYTGLAQLVDMLLDTPELQEMSAADLAKAQRKLLALSGEIAALLERKTDGAQGG